MSPVTVMKLPTLPRRPTIPLSDGEVLIGRELVYVDHRRDSFLPCAIFITNRRVALSPGIQRQTSTFLLLGLGWFIGVILAFSIGPVSCGLFWFGCIAACLVHGGYAVPKVEEEFPLDNIVLCTSANESGPFKNVWVTLVFACGARWRLKPKNNGVRSPRNHLALVLRQAGVVVTEDK